MKDAKVGNWDFQENAGQINVLFKGVVIDTLDLPGVLSLGVLAVNKVLPASLLPAAQMLETLGGQMLAAQE
jgi:hypothetical protein